MTRIARQTTRHRASRTNQSGQAMPLAAIGLFVMTLSILATLNLGQAVHQKIKLQNTADSAAYTLAAMEARTFNYIAFLNRAQIAHYNTAMVMQSYITWAGYYLAHYGATVDLFKVLVEDVSKGKDQRTECSKGDKCIWTVGYGILKALAWGMDETLGGMVEAYQAGAELGHDLVDAMAIFNRDIVWKAQFTRAALLNVHLLTGMQNHIEKMDPDLSFTQGKSMLINLMVNMALNSIEYYQTFDNASGVNPFIYGIVRDFKRVFPNFDGSYNSDDDSDWDGEDGYRLMAEMCNATRTPGFVSSRSESVTVQLGLANMKGRKMGQTKFTDSDSRLGAMITSIYDTENYSEGMYLSSNDFSLNAKGKAFTIMGAGFAQVSEFRPMMPLGDAIAAYQDEGLHLRYKTGGDSKSSMIKTQWSVIMPKGPASETEDHAVWQGFAPYFKFNAKADRTADYNQPSTWIFLNKHHQDFQTDQGSHSTQPTRAPWLSKFEWRSGDQVAFLDSTVGGSRNSYLFEGLNVVSRGMAYYHRPGNWKEHPNFFNPFWRARLAPVGQKLQSFWDRWVTGNISNSSDNKVVRGLVSILKGAQMDLFTAVITSMITH